MPQRQRWDGTGRFHLASSFGRGYTVSFMFKPLLLLIIAVLASCTGNQTVRMVVPKSAGNLMPEKGRVTIVGIEDKRTFERDPDEPSVPSVSPGIHAETSRETLVGRRRDTFGRAHGNVMLMKGVTVPEKVREIVGEGLARKGYAATESAGLPMQVEVVKFWGWKTISFANILNADIECVLHIGGGAKRLVVKGYGTHECHTGGRRHWEAVYRNAVEDFLKNMGRELSVAGY